MSESMNVPSGRKDFRRKLMTTASALALMASVYGAQPAIASDDDTDRPVLWIELGAQLERTDGGQVPFAPPFFDSVVNTGFHSPREAIHANIYSSGLEGAVSFTPGNSDWVVSGAVRYGRSVGHRFLQQQTKGVATLNFEKTANKYAPARYAQTKADNSEKHIIIDFQAGKDVGLGKFGGESTSVISAGIRFAQFGIKSDAAINARPDVHFAPVAFYALVFQLPRYHRYFGSAQRTMSFKGVGPSISWNGSAPFAGNRQDGQIALDWGANAAVLFGRQRAKMHDQTRDTYFYPVFLSLTPHYLPTHHGTGNRSRSAVVPNVGGFAGLSFRYSDAKLSLGYRADFFFGAIDGGLETRKSENRGFYGPFVSVSAGVGD